PRTGVRRARPPTVPGPAVAPSPAAGPRGWSLEPAPGPEGGGAPGAPRPPGTGRPTRLPADRRSAAAARAGPGRTRTRPRTGCPLQLTRRRAAATGPVGSTRPPRPRRGA